MLKRLKSILAAPPPETAGADGEERLRLAAAALLMEAALMDGHASDAEIATVTALLERHFALSPQEAEDLAGDGLESVRRSAELYGYTRIVKDGFSPEQRIALIEMLWQVAYADGELHDFEANLVRRVSGLIYVSDRDSGEARKRVRERLDLKAP